jgi:DNA-binding phage protein
VEGGTVGLFDPPANPFARPSGPSRAEVATQRLATLAAENADFAVLVRRLDDLEDRLAQAQAANVAARRAGRGAARGLDDAAAKLEAAVDAAYERGASLALTTLFHATPKAQARLDEVRSDSRAWNSLKEVLHQTAEPAYAIKEAAEKVENLASDLERLKAARDYRQDALYLAKRLGGDYAEVGGNILASAQSVRVSLATRKEATRLLTQVEEQRQLGGVDAEYARLVKDVKEARTTVARAAGVDRQDLIRTAAPHGRPKGIASDVPNPLDN